MNNSELQKAKEYKQLREFIKNTGFLICDDITPLTAEQEPPDFILNQGGKKIGIELTELIIKKSGRHNLKELEAFQNKILKQVREKLNKKILSCLTVEAEVHFSKPPDIQRGYDSVKIVQPLIDRIVNEVKDWDGEEYKKEYVRIDDIPGVHGVKIRSGMCRGIQWLPNNRLECMSIHWVKRDPFDEVVDALTKKEFRLADYRNKYDEVYLLLLGNRYEGSQAFELTDEFVRSTFLETSFDRVFYYDVHDKHGLEFIKKHHI